MSDTFDYLIVGAGSAGCVLANRLSANPDHQVCLIEAGPEDSSFLIKLPAGILGLMWDPRHNWKYSSEPEPHMNNRRMYCPRGKVLGGSSAINAMCYTRGHPEDFNQWGVPGWCWDDLLPHFKATEGQTRPNMDLEQHGYNGEQLVADVHQTIDPISRAFVDATVASGIAAETEDFSDGTLSGVGIYQTFQNGKARRCSAAHAFLHPIRHRENLTVITKAHVQNIEFDGQTAVGLRYRHKGVEKTLHAKREVILSTGAINSPQLLMLSGVGDEAELSQHDISLKHHLPGVGRNLQDHLDVVINTRINQYRGVGISLPFLFKAIWDGIRYLTVKKGFLTSNGAEAGGFFKTNSELEVANVQMHFAPLMLTRHFIRSIGHGHCLHLCNLKPKSRGQITLESADSNKAPKIQFNYGAQEDDIDVLVAAIKTGRKILEQEPLLALRKHEQAPGEAMQSDKELKAFIRQYAETIYHPVGTCKMGDDEFAVVNDQLQVHGVANLRVVDASIMPTINSANTHATVIAIANKAAALITSSQN